ncbi:IMPACT family protein [Actinomyces sp. HMSC06A08]|uniref:YigZ family protein n=1 Tax=Winkia neuii TaxID=33007 RepID=A0A2I1IK93_9ACTO|nr:YigZ family protein [Winkia neuii]OFJ70563.1 IMPACT family protein [Actinomyces sp. HMSC064C12]OFK00345.1 IMPACT family protein [Actinomyces sp. HMSC072A03]OFT56615.1 IMPACT family protein [Actinomyces sp. HMSC06A08]PKY71512.1 YigZ family protein [Winkia neuii]
MKTLQHFPVRTEIEIKRSRFLTTLTRVGSENEARAQIEQVRKQFPDARHHCTAFIVRARGAQPIERSSDDGEPSGTAGIPMLEALKGRELTDIVAIVTRYFGGIKLGTGGLVRAYTDSVVGAVEAATLVRLEERQLWQVGVEHAFAGKVEAALRGANWKISEVTYGPRLANLHLQLKDDQVRQLKNEVEELTRGAGKISYERRQVVEIPF